MAEFSNVLRLINAVSNFNDSSLGMSEKALTEFFRKVFKDEKTYGEFYHQGCLEMNEELFEYIKLHTGVTEFSEDAEDYIYGIITPISNPYISVSDNFQYVVTEMLHDACGYVGATLNDDEFACFQAFMDENISVRRYIEIAVGKKLGRPFEENNDIINEYAIGKGISPKIFYPTEETPKAEVKINVACKATQICNVRVERNVTDLVYAIIITANYDGDMGTIIAKSCSPMALKDYGFDVEECKEIGKLAVGELFTSHDYGNGVVVVRMA